MRFSRVVYLTKTIREELAKQSSEKRAKTEKTFVDTLLWMYREHDYRLIANIRKYFDRQRENNIEIVNKFQDQDYYKLGPDLHAATYALKLGGRIRLHGSSRWISEKENSQQRLLPNSRVTNFHLEGVDLSRTVIKENGISNIETCKNLRTLILSDCFYADDWMLNRIAHSFSSTLESLDISNCSKITDNGLLPLAFLKNLKHLNLSNLNGVKNKEFIALLIEEEIENLKISGSDHMSDEALKAVQHKMDKEEQELKKILNSS